MKIEEIKFYDQKLRQWFCEPKNIRPVRESVIGALFVFLLLGLTLPFNLEDMGEGRYVYIVGMSIITMVVSIVNGLFATYALRLPLDPKLPLRKVHLNSLLHYVVCIPFLAFWLTVYGGYRHRKAHPRVEKQCGCGEGAGLVSSQPRLILNLNRSSNTTCIMPWMSSSRGVRLRARCPMVRRRFISTQGWRR